MSSACCEHTQFKVIEGWLRGKPRNNQLDDQVKQGTIELFYSQYHHFGPTLAQEKLAEKHGLELSVETVRKLMIR